MIHLAIAGVTHCDLDLLLGMGQQVWGINLAEHLDRTSGNRQVSNTEKTLVCLSGVQQGKPVAVPEEHTYAFTQIVWLVLGDEYLVQDLLNFFPTGYRLVVDLPRNHNKVAIFVTTLAEVLKMLATKARHPDAIQQALTQMQFALEQKQLMGFTQQAKRLT